MSPPRLRPLPLRPRLGVYGFHDPAAGSYWRVRVLWADARFVDLIRQRWDGGAWERPVYVQVSRAVWRAAVLRIREGAS